MGYIKAEYGKNNTFDLEIEVKNCNSIECLSFASSIAEEILNSIAKENSKTPTGYKKSVYRIQKSAYRCDRERGA